LPRNILPQPAWNAQIVQRMHAARAIQIAGPRVAVNPSWCNLVRASPKRPIMKMKAIQERKAVMSENRE